MNNNLWKYALPLLATLVAAGMAIWLRPPQPTGQAWSVQQSAPHSNQTVARPPTPSPSTQHCAPGERTPAGLSTTDLDNMLRACTEPTR